MSQAWPQGHQGDMEGRDRRQKGAQTLPPTSADEETEALGGVCGMNLRTGNSLEKSTEASRIWAPATLF